jgi:hypothetical protein
MADDLKNTDIALAAMTDMEGHLELELEKLANRAKALEADLSTVREAKRIFLASRGAISIDDAESLKSSLPEVSERRGTPENWLFSQYRLLGSKKAIERILEERKQPVEIEDLVKELYDTHSEDEFKRARNTLSAALRRGASEGAWQKSGRSFYAANSVDATGSAVARDNTIDVGLLQNQTNEAEQEQPTHGSHACELAV